jgi:hypothetical protein
VPDPRCVQIEAGPRRAVGTENHVRLARIDVDVRVVQRREHAAALEFPHPGAKFRDSAVVPELRVAPAGHRLRPCGYGMARPSRSGLDMIGDLCERRAADRWISWFSGSI